MSAKCGPVVRDDDGCSFLCMGCGVRVNRTRDNPFPKIAHGTKTKITKGSKKSSPPSRGCP